MQLQGMEFSQLDWLPKTAEGACFAMSVKWAVRSLLTHNINQYYIYGAKQNEEGKAPEKTAKKLEEKFNTYVALADEKAGNKAAALEKSLENLSPAELYEAVYSAEAQLVEPWAQAIAIKKQRNVVTQSYLDVASLHTWAEGHASALEGNFSLVYSFHYTAYTSKQPDDDDDGDGSHSVAFLKMGASARFFDPNAGVYFFLGDGNTLLEWLQAVDARIAQHYVVDVSAKQSVVHHIKVAQQ